MPTKVRYIDEYYGPDSFSYTFVQWITYRLLYHSLKHGSLLENQPKLQLSNNIDKVEGEMSSANTYRNAFEMDMDN
jgi:hypothetical protein